MSPWFLLVVIFTLGCYVSITTSEKLTRTTAAATGTKSMSEEMDSTSNNSAGTTATKTIYMIRHAESEENRRLGCLSNALKDMTRFRVPKSKDISDGMEWITKTSEQVDSPVSEKGQKQIENMASVLRLSNFVAESQIELVAHSPLQRARQTSQGMLGCSCTMNVDAKNNDMGDEFVVMKPESVKRVVQLEALKEKTPKEWIVNSQRFHDRLSELEMWLHAQPEQVIALVGHSQHFKALLNLSFKFGNCDVWRIEFDGTREKKDYVDDLPTKWSNLKKIHSGSTIPPKPTETESFPNLQESSS